MVWCALIECDWTGEMKDLDYREAGCAKRKASLGQLEGVGRRGKGRNDGIMF